MALTRLAHCKQMNHSRAFWSVRNQYAELMRGLWSRGYTGEGLWGRGALLATGEFEKNGVEPGETLPEHLCGGTYRSRGQKRKAKKVLSYQEQKERRILKKFGANGVALGEDTEVKKKLEKGRKVSAKPRVAGSARGRELRAAAALARFEQKKEEVVKVESDDETESGSEDYEDDEVGIADAVDFNGKRLLDTKGRGMIKVCEDENPDDGDAHNELLELQGFSLVKKPNIGIASASTNSIRKTLDEGSGAEPKMKEEDDKVQICKPQAANRSLPEGIRVTQKNERSKLASTPKPLEPKDPPRIMDTTSGICSVCSFVNDKMAPTCGICSNVLHIKSMPGAWACESQTCRGSSYRNAADCGVCGVCGQRKAAVR